MIASILRSIHLLIILTILVSNSGIALGQTKGFSRDPAVFIVEYGELLATAGDKNVSSMFDTLQRYWTENKFSEEQQDMVIRMATQMQLGKSKVKPDFAILTATLIAGKDSSVNPEKFDNWLQESYKLLKIDKPRFLDLLTTSNRIFRDQTLYSDASKRWIFTGSDYSFVFDKNDVYVDIASCDLVSKAPDDQMAIRSTSGRYNVHTRSFRGTKGTINWERVGIPASDCYAEFGTYQIDLSKGEFEKDSVLFTYTGVLSEKVLGKLKDKNSSGRLSDQRTDFSDAPYPEFTSYNNDLKISAFGDKQVRFRGGFKLEGKEIKGVGSGKRPAIFEFYYNDILTVKVVSSHFSITDEKITALETEATVYTDSGEIFHPMVKFSFLREKKKITLTRGTKGIEQAPFYDTDHNLEIWVDQIIWEMTQPRIEFDMILEEAKARFESKNFYREFNYERLRLGMLSYHPITKIYKHCITIRSDSFQLGDYALAIGSKKENLLPQIFMLADEGFIYYNYKTEQVKVKEKLFNYYKNHFKLADYDVIRFVSVIGKKPNAVLNLVNYDLELEGVRLFHFSDSQNVVVMPREQKVTVKNNRRLKFAGRVTAGRFDFYGSNFDFSYENFTIEGYQIDSMKLFYPDTLGGNYLIPVKSVLRDLNGTLYIDKSNNKSGITDYPEYPRFVSRSPSVISYDKKGIHNGAYKKDIFRFEVDPFTIDSMDNFTITGLRFPGTFVSAGIVPDFKYEAYIMKDYSLGFERANPPGGYPMYGGKGRGNIDISMSEEGFRARGEIDYEGAKLKSRDIIMMPDSLNAQVEEYSIAKSSKYPRLMARDVFSHWKPKGDSMYINTKGHEVDIFSAGQVFTGNLVQTPNQLAGGGLLAWDNAKLRSEAIVFGPEKADAAVSSIQIGDIDAGMISFASNNVKSHIDFEKRTGDFRANELGQFAEFAFNQYATTMDDFKWDMNRKTILVTSSGRMSPEKSIFLSRKHEQSGLSFQSTKALFDMNTGIIYAEEIPHIDIADSRAFPFEGKAVIEKDAFMRPLEQSKLLASRENKYHELFNCTLRIQGKYALGGEGSYYFKDKHDTKQVIFFDKMKVTRDTTVNAGGYISDSMAFSISPKIGYKGAVDLFSDQEYLRFNGYAKPLHTFADFNTQWFRYSNQPDPSNVIVNASDPKSEIRKSLSVSMNIAPVDSVNVYASFFDYKRSYGDLELTTDTGILYYDESEQTFFVGDSNRLLNNAASGSYLSFNESTRMIESRGEINLGLELQDKYFIRPAGRIFKHESDTVFNIEALWAMRMLLPDECYVRMQEVIAKNGAEAPKVNVKREDVRSRVAELLEPKKFERVWKSVQESGNLDINGELGTDFIFSSTNLAYNKRLGAFAGYDPIEIASIKDKSINQAFDSRILIEQKRSGTLIILYIQVSKYDWFYFEYQRGNLFIGSTDKEFNEALRDKAGKINKQGYILRPASPTKVDRQIEKMDTLR